MKILLVGPWIEENLSLTYLAATLERSGHEAALARFNDAGDRPAVIEQAQGYDAVGISMQFQCRTGEFLELARELKRKKPAPLIIAGGHYASCAAADLLRHHPELDLIVIHEGERTLVEIAAAGENLPATLAEIQGICFRQGDEIVLTPPRPLLANLDELPFPVRRYPACTLAGVPTAYLLGSRGCFYSCGYCCIQTLHQLAPGARFRQRSVENIADEMAVLYHQRGIRQFVFHDDNFLTPSSRGNLERLESLDRALGERKIADIAILTKARPADVQPEIIAKLREMGLIRLFLGIESSTDEILVSLNRHQTVAHVEAALEVCRSLGISAQFTLMVFNPESTWGSIESDIAFMRRYLDHPFNFCRTEIYAGTPLERKMINEGRARGNYLARTYSFHEPAIELASTLAAKIFLERCWGGNGLMKKAIGLDHLTTILTHFYPTVETAEFVARFRSWQSEVNSSTVSLLEEMVSLCLPNPQIRDSGFRRAVRALASRESADNHRLLGRWTQLSAELDSITSSFINARLREADRKSTPAAPSLLRHAAAVVLALGLAGGLSNCLPGDGVSEQAPPPLTDTDHDGLPDQCEQQIFGTDPLLQDTDGDGILDGQEDHDGDGFTNQQEQDHFGKWRCGDWNG